MSLGYRCYGQIAKDMNWSVNECKISCEQNAMSLMLDSQQNYLKN